ncbi:hypothetical protein [uncultured Methanospirillum sp.]|uniref:hypothetical protein n=1 Tax=uncultured Methanospirillum sp. TaxID=262503 RepID=UPI0029C9288D|nr:hypothetical protein [uncultured Methanospirillum sp.]
MQIINKDSAASGSFIFEIKPKIEVSTLVGKTLATGCKAELSYNPALFIQVLHRYNINLGESASVTWYLLFYNKGSQFSIPRYNNLLTIEFKATKN